MISPISLRRYVATDLDACVAIWRTASVAGHPFLSRQDLNEDEVLVREVYFPKADITLACERGVTLGFVAMIGNFIGGLFVAPERHQQGIGRMLVRSASKKYESLEVEVYEANTGACRFYRQLGFVETSRRDMDDRQRPYALLKMELPRIDRMQAS